MPPDDIELAMPPAGMPGGPPARAAEMPEDDGDLARACGELEIVRRHCLARLLKRMLVSAAAAAAFAASIAAYSAQPDVSTIVIVSGITLLIGWIYWTRLPRAEYREYHAAKFVPDAVRVLGRYRYEAEATMPRAWLWRSGLLPEHSVYLSRGVFSAERSGIVVQFAPAELRRHGTYHGFNGPTEGAAPGLAFGGLLILLSLRTSFSGRTLLLPDRGPLLNLFTDVPSDLDVVHPRLRTACGRFEVLSTDADEARRLVSSRFIERLHGHVGSLGGRRLRLSFYDAQVLMTVPLKNKLFRAPSMFRRPARNATGASLLRVFETMDEITETLHRQVTVGS